MATHKSAVKRHRQNRTRRLNNQARRTRMKNITKEVVSASEAGDRRSAQAAFDRAVPIIQKAAARKTIHRNAAARKISRLARRVNSIPSDK